MQPEGNRIAVPPGTTAMAAVLQAGTPLEGPCGGRGQCGKCRVRVLAGRAAPSDDDRRQFSAEELEDGWRLACGLRLQEDTVIEIPSASLLAAPQIMVSGEEAPVAFDPYLTKHYCELSSPRLDDDRADLARLLDALPAGATCRDLSALQDLPSLLRDADFHVTATLAGEEVIDLEPGDTSESLYGIAYDLGTTTVVGYLVNLVNGEQVAVASQMNAQTVYGEDVISRIEFAQETPDGRALLRERIVGVMNEILFVAAGDAGIDAAQVREATVVGNTCMTHLFLGIDPAFLAQAPYVPAVTAAQDLAAGELGLALHPRGRVHVLPNIAGFVGADTVGVMLASRIADLPGARLAVDIGTNGEVVGYRDGRLVVCSTAAGPAWEGARIGRGMRAAPGAIDRVTIDDDVRVTTVGGQPARGICGSGLLDAIAEMRRANLVDETGRLRSPAEAAGLPPALARRLVSGPDGPEFLLTEDPAVALTQRDLREAQLAKAAIATGIRLVMRALGVTPEQLDEVLLAGAFGSYLQPESAVAIGLLPALPRERLRAIGNAAGAGARLALLSRGARRRAAQLATSAEHLQLAHDPSFQDHFVDALALAPQA
jgi:uncharacterized 2Fe-2S/4Fe-4S cluster protein (DUF4445 family)